MFTLRISEQDYIAASTSLEAAQGELASLAPAIIDAHFDRLALRTRKSELEEMHRLGFDGGSYQNYTAERRRKPHAWTDRTYSRRWFWADEYRRPTSDPPWNVFSAKLQGQREVRCGGQANCP